MICDTPSGCSSQLRRSFLFQLPIVASYLRATSFAQIAIQRFCQCTCVCVCVCACVCVCVPAHACLNRRAHTYISHSTKRHWCGFTSRLRCTRHSSSWPSSPPSALRLTPSSTDPCNPCSLAEKAGENTKLSGRRSWHRCRRQEL